MCVCFNASTVHLRIGSDVYICASRSDVLHFVEVALDKAATCRVVRSIPESRERRRREKGMNVPYLIKGKNVMQLSCVYSPYHKLHAALWRLHCFLYGAH